MRAPPGRGRHGDRQAAHHHVGPILAYLGAVPLLRMVPFLHRSPPPLLDGPVESTVDFPAVQPPAEPYRWPRAQILSGNPVQTATYIYMSPDNLFAAGIWTCEIGKFRIDFGRAEFIQILEAWWSSPMPRAPRRPTGPATLRDPEASPAPGT